MEKRSKKLRFERIKRLEEILKENLEKVFGISNIRIHYSISDESEIHNYIEFRNQNKTNRCKNALNSLLENLKINSPEIININIIPLNKDIYRAKLVINHGFEIDKKLRPKYDTIIKINRFLESYLLKNK